MPMPTRIPSMVSMAGLEEANNVAIIFGATGLVGREIARSLICSESSWKVYGVARNPEIQQPIISMKSCNPYHFISCDLLNPLETYKKLSPLHDVTHVFWVTWASQFPLDSQLCCEQNETMMSNALNTLILVAKNLKHVSLQTGTKHYISLQAPFEHHHQKLHYHYYHEEFPRIPSKTPNFYYALEDLLMERLNGNKVSCSVHRPGLLLGNSTRSFYNFMGSLCVYGTLCKHLKVPFIFGGTRKCWQEPYIDASDSRLVAEQHIWAAKIQQELTDYCYRKGEAFNAINGSSFTWKEIWPILGKKLGAYVPEEEEMVYEEFWYSREMGDEKKKKVWEEIVEKHGLVRTKMEDLVNWGFLDALFRFPVKLLVSRDKVDEFGFVKRCNTLDCMLYWIDHMRDKKLIPRLDF